MLAKGYMAIGGVRTTGAILPTKHCKRLIKTRIYGEELRKGGVVKAIKWVRCNK